MARAGLHAKKIAREYARSLAPTLNVDGVVLFGSHARGEGRAGSDIDLVVLSKDFRMMSLMHRLQLLNRLRRGSALAVPMDIIGLTPQEFSKLKKSDSLNLRGIYRDSLRVYP